MTTGTANLHPLATAMVVGAGIAAIVLAAAAP